MRISKSATARWTSTWRVLASIVMLTSLLVTENLIGQEHVRTLSGVVFDDETGAPLRGVTVTLLSEDLSSAITRAETDDQGRFELPVALGRYSFIASRAGYATSAPVGDTPIFALWRHPVLRT